MALSNLFRGNIFTTLLVGVGAATLGPVVLPAIAKAGRPLAKSMIKAGLVFYKEALEELDIKTLVAEAQSELKPDATAVEPTSDDATKSTP